MKAEKPKGYNYRWRRINEERPFLEYLGPHYSRAVLDDRVEDFLDQVFHVWLDRFPIVCAPDAEAETVLWAHDAEKKVSTFAHQRIPRGYLQILSSVFVIKWVG
jgi:hypothetical protein